MKCYYEELGVDRDANESGIKTAYRKLALKWHPDKNLDSIEIAKDRFQLIQQAYDVLSDPQERAWYDNHREQILRGKNSDYKDNCLDVFQYFTVSCFAGYGDDSKGFYAIYREVFAKISAEDTEFMNCEEEMQSIAKFGDSTSSYEDVVGPFYAYWSAYCTKRTYTWLCPYDIKEIRDRRILRQEEKYMKKVIQKAKKERNEEVRNLVSFVRKRDKRVQAYKRLLEERSAFNKQKQERNRLEQIRRRQQELEEMKQNTQAVNGNSDDYEEQIKQLEQQYSSEDEYENEDELVAEETLETHPYMDGFYCVACNKEFKNDKSFANHEISRKHRDNVDKLKIEMKDDEDFSQLLQKGVNELEVEETQHLENQTTAQRNKTVKLKDKRNAKNMKDITEEITEKSEDKLNTSNNFDKDDDNWVSTNKKLNRKIRNKHKVYKNNSNTFEQSFQIQNESEPAFKPENQNEVSLKSEINQHICATCKSKFESKNKLFCHLKITNHGVYIPKTKLTNEDNMKPRKTKCKKNN